MYIHDDVIVIAQYKMVARMVSGAIYAKSRMRGKIFIDPCRRSPSHGCYSFKRANPSHIVCATQKCQVTWLKDHAFHYLCHNHHHYQHPLVQWNLSMMVTV